MGRHDYIRGGLGLRMGSDAARTRRTGNVTRNQLAYGIVGHAEASPAYVELRHGQPWVEVTMEPEGDEIMARVAFPSAGAQSGWYLPISFGCRVILEFIDGDPQGALIVGRLFDETCALPGTAAGVSTGAANARGDVTAAAPAWTFQVLPSGQLLAIETGTNGDILIHSGAAVEVKCAATQRIHLNGAVSLGVGPASAPTGATVGPGGTDLPGTPAVSAVPIPYTTPLPVPPDGINPFVGDTDSMVRAKQLFQSTIALDPNFWAKLTTIASNPLIGVGPILSLTMGISSAGGQPGSKHTASD